MRLQQYINEKKYKSTEYMQFVDAMFKNCKPFIRDITGIQPISVYRGMSSSSNGVFGEKKVRKNRIPSSTPIQTHEYLDEMFDEKFGIKARSETLFCYFYEDNAEAYGDVYTIFPMGKYKVIWNPKIEDLTVDLHQYGYSYHPHNGNQVQQNMKILDSVIGGYKIGNISDAYHDTGISELMIYTNKYYYVEDYDNVVIDEIKRRL